MAEPFTLEFSLPPAQAARLRQHAALANATVSPARVLGIVWHDGATHELAGQGLALARVRQAWRLEHVYPSAIAWPLAGPAPVLGQATHLAQLPVKLPDGFVPFARFSGRETQFTLPGFPAPVTAQLLRGRIKADTHALACARLRLQGPEMATLALAQTLAETVGLLPPRASLAAEAIALRADGKPPPRAFGAFRFADGIPVGEALPRVLSYLGDAMLHWSRTIGAPGADAEPVHQMRVAIRRMRSAISIFRDVSGSPAVLRVGGQLRQLGLLLGPARDWDVFLAGQGQRIAEALSGEAAIGHLLHAAERQRGQAYERLAAHMKGTEFRALCIALAAIANGTSWRDGLDAEQLAAQPVPLETFAADVLARRHRRVRRRGAHFRHLDIGALHELRLAAKRLRYAAEFFAPLFAPRASSRYIRRLAALQDQLGFLNDGAVVDSLLAVLGSPTGARAYGIGLARGFVIAHAIHEREQLGRVWKRFHKLDPFWN